MLYKQVLGKQSDLETSILPHTESGFEVSRGSLKPNGPEDTQDARAQIQWPVQFDDCLVQRECTSIRRLKLC